MQLDGRTAVVTGAASGIGLGLTERLLREGMSVVMADIDEAALAVETARLADDGGAVRAVACDVADAAQVQALRDEALSAFGAVHLLVNNAGVASGGPGHLTPPAVYDWVVSVNVLGVAYGVSAFVPAMLEQGEGHVVNTASEAGLNPTPFLGAYHTAKYAVVGLSESLALELEGKPVGVSCLCPELVNTKIFSSTRNAPPELGLPPAPDVPMAQLEQFMKTVAMDPADVAADIVYAVRANRFWIITHDATRSRVAQRNDRLETNRNPKASGDPS